MLLDQIDFLGTQIARLTMRIDEQLAAIRAAGASTPTAPPAPAPAPSPCRPSPGSMRSPASAPSWPPRSSAEIGLDMTRFPTPGHLVSWAGLCPRTIQSGARSRTGNTGQGNAWLARVPGQRRHRRRPHQHLPRRTLPAHRPPPRRRPRPGRHRPLHPGHHLAPAHRPHRPLPRPRRRLLRTPESTRAAKLATTSASSKPSATPSPSPRPPNR